MSADRIAEQWAVVERAVELAKQGEAFAMATVVWRQGPTSGHQGSRAIVTAAGEIHGWIGGACAEPVLVREAQRVIESGEAKLLWLGVDSEDVPDGVTSIAIACQSEGALQIFIEPVQAAPRVVIVGRSPLAHTLDTLASAVGWNVTLVDGLELGSAIIDGSTAVIVATQGHGDEDILEQVVALQPAYIGVVASKRRGEAVVGYLRERNVAPETLERIHAPVGLDLGHTTHREVAVSILAELVALRASGVLRGVSPTRASRVAAPLEAHDPVCGMTVTADESARPFDHDGTTYYFCCPGCRTKFAADPGAYLAQGTTC